MDTRTDLVEALRAKLVGSSDERARRINRIIDRAVMGDFHSHLSPYPNPKQLLADMLDHAWLGPIAGDVLAGVYDEPEAPKSDAILAAHFANQPDVLDRLGMRIGGDA